MVWEVHVAATDKDGAAAKVASKTLSERIVDDLLSAVLEMRCGKLKGSWRYGVVFISRHGVTVNEQKLSVDILALASVSRSLIILIPACRSLMALATRQARIVQLASTHWRSGDVV
jgi:hypothetical protein